MKQMILIEDYCSYYQCEVSFIDELASNGLIFLVQENNQRFIQHDDLALMEKFRSWHQDLDINIAGLEVIYQLMQRMELLQDEVKSLKQYRILL